MIAVSLSVKGGSSMSFYEVDGLLRLCPLLSGFCIDRLLEVRSASPSTSTVASAAYSGSVKLSEVLMLDEYPTGYVHGIRVRGHASEDSVLM